MLQAPSPDHFGVLLSICPLYLRSHAVSKSVIASTVLYLDNTYAILLIVVRARENILPITLVISARLAMSAIPRPAM